MTDPNVPIDPLHVQCIEARNGIRMHVKVLQRHAAEWEPRPMPEDWR